MNKYTVLVLFCINIQKSDGVGCAVLIQFVCYSCCICNIIVIGRFALQMF